MASDKIEIENSDRELKYLGFVRIVAINTVVCLSNIYHNAKEKSGPLKSTIVTAESAVTTIAVPVYKKFKDLPSDLLVFVDNKVDEATHKFDEHAPPLAKQVVSHAQSILQKASGVARRLVQEVNVGGPEAAIRYTGSLCKDLSVNQLANLWYGINQIQPLHVVTGMALPTATHWSEKYNSTVADLAAKGYNVFGYFPLVPVNEMAKAYKRVEASKKGEVVEPESKTDGVEASKKGEVVEPETNTHVVEPETETDGVEPESKTDGVEASKKGEVVEPETNTHVVEFETETDGVEA